MGVNQIYFSDHFAVNTNIKSLCCPSETNIIFNENYTTIKKR